MTFRGATAVGGRLAALSGFVGGSVLTYVIFIAHLPALWIVPVAACLLLAVLAVGSYLAWSEVHQLVVRFMPTWEHIQTRADNLRALVNEYEELGGHGFRRQFNAGYFAVTARDYDRAVAAGYPPAFARERLGRATLDDVKELVDAFDDVVVRWRSAESELHQRRGLTDRAGSSGHQPSRQVGR